MGGCWELWFTAVLSPDEVAAYIADAPGLIRCRSVSISY